MAASKLVIALWFLLVGASSIYAQTDHNASLLISKCKADEGICDTQEIVRYDFVDGALAGNETVFSSRTDQVRFDLFRNRILDDRLLITGWGDVVDLRTKNVLIRGEGEVIRLAGRRVITQVDRVDKEGIFAFDLDTKRYEIIRTLKNWPSISEDSFSPSGDLVASWELKNGSGARFTFSTVDDKLNLRKIKSVDGKFIASCSVRCSSTDGGPFVWVDDSKILTQTANGSLVTVSTSGTIEKVVELNIDEDPDSLPYFSTDPFGNLFYSCGDTIYLIDVAHKTYSVDRLPIGNGFERRQGQGFSSIYFLDGSSIGTIWSGNAVTTKNYLAATYAKEGQNLGYPDGIKVWNSTRKNWITIEVNWGARIIGWMGNSAPNQRASSN